MQANAKKLFELFRKKGVFRKNLKETVGNWTTSQIGSFLEECEGIAPYVESTDLGSHTFDFAASSTLSGACYPCSHPNCRLKQVDRVARFAALYANHVLILNPLPAHAPEVVDRNFRLRLCGDLQVLNHVRPLLEAGIVGLSPNYFALCDHHFAQLRHAEQKLRREASQVLSPISNTSPSSSVRRTNTYSWNSKAQRRFLNMVVACVLSRESWPA